MAILAYFVMFLFTIASTVAFIQPSTATPKLYSTVVYMSIWGSQKVGRPVINVPQSGNEDSSAVTSSFKRKTVGAGNDERPSSPLDSISQGIASNGEPDWPVVSKMSMNLQQKALLMSLTSDDLGIEDKKERIRLASTYEKLLPSSFSKQTLVSPKLQAGGMMKDWDFDF